MPEQSVRQFRPGWMLRGEWDRLRDDIHDSTREYIERLENALDWVAERAASNEFDFCTPNTYLGTTIYGEDSEERETLRWLFLQGDGDSLLEAIEDDMKGNTND